jgi:uncharacterized protein YecT (DUF1311 family)
MINVPRHSFLILAVTMLIFTRICEAKADEECMALSGEQLIRTCLFKTDTTLQKTLQVVLTGYVAMSDLRHRDLLLKSQSAWVQYEDAECELEGDAYRGGTLESDQAALCEISKIRDRIRELKDDHAMTEH